MSHESNVIYSKIIKILKSFGNSKSLGGRQNESIQTDALKTNNYTVFSYHFFNFLHLHWISQDFSLFFLFTFSAKYKKT